jgi:hypothetical protein
VAWISYPTFDSLIMSVEPGQRQLGLSEIRVKIEVQNLYSNPKQLKRFLVLLENIDQNEKISFETGLTGCEIEHIMPQAREPHWLNVSTDEHERWLTTWAISR